MRHAHSFQRVLLVVGWLAALASTAVAFEGRIHAVMIQGNETNALLYTVGTNSVRVEMTATNWPNPVDILDCNPGTLTLLFPNNRSFVHLKPATEAASMGAPVMPGMPMPPAGLPQGVGPQSAPGAPSIPTMPNMPTPMMPNAKLELQATGQRTNLLGFACQQYQLKQRGQTLEIWATDQLPPYQSYIRNQPHQFGPHMIEEQWPALVADKKLFPMIASLRYGSGAERMRFEVTSVSAEKIVEPDEKLFQPPPQYHEVRPLPF